MAGAPSTFRQGGRSVERRRLAIAGVVQGVGFRPHVHRLASELRLSGFVRNDADGVLVEVEGPAKTLETFEHALREDPPPLAAIRSLSSESLPPTGAEGFDISESAAGRGGASIPPDTATCPDCLAEVIDPGDRRHRYPFANCTRCGPRLTIVESVPYDRSRTTMAAFEMCAECRAEYEDPSDRRFHAEPIACPACGPRLEMPLEDAVEVIAGGGVLAVKGLGGWHLACDATSEEAVQRLRRRKQREEKPLAVMTDRLGELVDPTPAERALLASPAAPIVLMRRRSDAPVARSVAPGSPELGVMLPYTPLHHLLCATAARPLVMTSGNRTDEPICTDDREARERLAGIADAFLGNDRPIRRRCEDSVVRAEHPVRRSRGFAPAALALPVPSPVPLVAVGADLKNTFCVAAGGEAHLSAHMGDLDSPLAWTALQDDLRLYLEMLGLEPRAVAHDLHPDYRSTRVAHELGLPAVGVQHHHAHAAACLAEHGEQGPCLAIVFDGTGYGPDGTIWGGELLRCDLLGYERICHLEPVPMPGGDAAVREPWRMAAAYLERCGRPVPFDRWRDVRQSLAVNAPPSSGMGRLFDAVAALLGVREAISYEGQAAVELEHLAGSREADPYPCRVGEAIRGSDLVARAHDDLAAGRPREEIAAAFVEGVALAAVEAALAAGEPGTVVLSGGCFQNRRLAASVRSRLEEAGRRVLEHRLVPPNDGGVSLGQAAIAAATFAMKEED